MTDVALAQRTWDILRKATSVSGPSASGKRTPPVYSFVGKKERRAPPLNQHQGADATAAAPGEAGGSTVSIFVRGAYSF